MKKIGIVICFGMVILFSQVNEVALGMEAASVNNQSAAEVNPILSPSVEQRNSSSQALDDIDNPEQSNARGIAFEPNNEPSSLPETPRQQSTLKPKETGLSPIDATTDTTIEGLVLNSLPEISTPKDPDTLGMIIQWWSSNPLKMRLWYLFLTISVIMFLCGQTSFRKPFLFVSLVIFGFYFGNTVNPINSIFALSIETNTKFINSLVLVMIPIMLSLFIGRFFCGWACPIGAVQEFIHPENLKLRLPSLLDRICSYFRFLLLIGGILLSWSAMSNIWNSYDPFQSLFTYKWSLSTISLSSIVLIGSIFIERFFCRYLCPLGAVLTITSRFSLIKMSPDSDACIVCGKCSQPGICSMNMISSVNPYTDIPTIESSECIVCHRCADICRYSAIRLSFSKKLKTKSHKIEKSITS